MPQAAIVAGIQAGATLGAAGIGARSNSAAMRSQAKAGMNALGHELRSDKRRSQMDQRDFDEYRRLHDEWRQRNFGQTELTRPGQGGTPRNQPMPAPGAAPGAAPQGRTLADLLGIDPAAAGLMPNAIPGQTPGMQPGGRTLADILDWQRYGA